jgi:hypothetical protein
MSDKIEREIEEIMKRLGEPAPREGTRERVRRLVRDWTGGLRRTIALRVPHLSARWIKLASLVLVVLVAAGLFFGLVYPGSALTGGGSADEETTQESIADQAGEGAGVDDAWQDGSDDEAPGTEGSESREEADHAPDGHEEGDDERGDGDGGHEEGHED